MAAFLHRPRRHRPTPAGGRLIPPSAKAPSLAATALVSLALTACGGGGDSDPTATLPPALPTQPPLLETSPTPEATEEVNGAQEYTVQEGDTLSGIADQFGVSLDALIAANPLENPDLLQPGDTLTIPAAEPETEGAEPTPTP